MSVLEIFENLSYELERLKPRGKGPDPLADRYPLGRDVVAPIEWRSEQTPRPARGVRFSVPVLVPVSAPFRCRFWCRSEVGRWWQNRGI